MDNESFYTLKGYDKINKSELSPAMEDYLEMIYREVLKNDHTRINIIASKLNVKPPAASKMALRLKHLGLINFEPYDIITLTEKGKLEGEYLLNRHNILIRFFKSLNGSDFTLEQVERIEHFIDAKTLINLEKLIPVLHKFQREK